MRTHYLGIKSWRRFVQTTDSRQDCRAFPNRYGYILDKTDRVWVAIVQFYPAYRCCVNHLP